MSNELGRRPILRPVVAGKDMLTGVGSSARELGLRQPQDKELSARILRLNEFECGFGFAIGHR